MISQQVCFHHGIATTIKSFASPSDLPWFVWPLTLADLLPSLACAYSPSPDDKSAGIFHCNIATTVRSFASPSNLTLIFFLLLHVTTCHSLFLLWNLPRNHLSVRPAMCHPLVFYLIHLDCQVIFSFVEYHSFGQTSSSASHFIVTLKPWFHRCLHFISRTGSGFFDVPLSMEMSFWWNHVEVHYGQGLLDIHVPPILPHDHNFTIVKPTTWT